MKNFLKALPFIIGLLSVILIFIIINAITSRMKLVPANEPGTIGNSTGNLYNHGLFCEQGDYIYFANGYDGNNIYRMKLDGSSLERIVQGDAAFLNVAGNHIFYYLESTGGQAGLGYLRSGRGIYHSRLDGSDTVILQQTTSDSLLLVDNNLYYTNFDATENKDGNAVITVHSMTTNGEEDTLLFYDHPKIASYYNGLLYYAGMENDHFLHGIDPTTDTEQDLITQTMYLPIIYYGFIYYIDPLDNYCLKSYSLSDSTITTIVSERVDTYNIVGNYIYYQNANPDHYALKRIFLNGSGEEIVKDGVYCDINVTSQYIYFHPYNSDMPIYRTPTEGGINVTTFDEAMPTQM